MAICRLCQFQAFHNSICTFEIIVEPIDEVSSRAKVNEPDLLRTRVDQDVLILYIPVEDASIVTEEDCLKNLKDYCLVEDDVL